MKSESPQDSLRRLRHDIMGCLNSLVLTAEVLSGNLPAEDALEFLDGMDRAADKLSGLIEQIPEKTQSKVS